MNRSPLPANSSLTNTLEPKAIYLSISEQHRQKSIFTAAIHHDSLNLRHGHGARHRHLGSKPFHDDQRGVSLCPPFVVQVDHADFHDIGWRGHCRCIDD